MIRCENIFTMPYLWNNYHQYWEVTSTKNPSPYLGKCLKNTFSFKNFHFVVVLFLAYLKNVPICQKGNISGLFLFTISDIKRKLIFSPPHTHHWRAISALCPHHFPGNDIIPELRLGTKGKHWQQQGLPWEVRPQKTLVNCGSGLGCLGRNSWFCVLVVWDRRAGDGVLGICVSLSWPLIFSPCEKCHGQNRADVGPSKCPGSSHLKLVQAVLRISFNTSKFFSVR